MSKVGDFFLHNFALLRLESEFVFPTKLEDLFKDMDVEFFILQLLYRIRSGPNTKVVNETVGVALSDLDNED